MAKAVAIVFADSHLQQGAWANRGVLGDSYHSFGQIVDRAVNAGLPLIGAGDLIDKSRNTSGPIVEMALQLSRLAEVGLKLYYVQGQHEMASRPWLEVSRGAVVHIDGVSVDIGGLQVRGLDFRDAQGLKAGLESVSAADDVLVAHQVWLEFMGEKACPQGSFADVPFVKTLITGDYHASLIRTAVNRHGRLMTVLSPGSTCMQAIDEEQNKSFYVLWDDATVSQESLATRRVVRVVVSDDDSLDEALERLPELVEHAMAEAEALKLPPAIAKPLVRVSYRPAVADIRKRIAAAPWSRDVHVFWKLIKDEVRRVGPSVLASGGGGRAALADCLPEYLEKAGKTHVLGLCQALLVADDPAERLSEIVSARLKAASVAD